MNLNIDEANYAFDNEDDYDIYDVVHIQLWAKLQSFDSAAPLLNSPTNICKAARERCLRDAILSAMNAATKAIDPDDSSAVSELRAILVCAEVVANRLTSLTHTSANDM